MKLEKRKYLKITAILVLILLGCGNLNAEVISNVRIVETVQESDLPHTVNELPLSVTADSYLGSRYKLTRGFVCSSERDIKCVNELCGDSEHYWAIILNDNEQNTSLNSLVSSGDVLELVYRKKTTQDHQRLQDWLLSSGKER